LSEAFAETLTVPEAVAPEDGDVIETTGGVLSVLLVETVTVTVALVVVCPAELLAAAESEWLPLERLVVFSDKVNGALVTAAPELLPSTLNCTFVVLEETLVKTETVPETVAPETGEVIAIVGAAPLLTVTVTAALEVDCPAELLAKAESEWLPLESVVVFNDKLNGALLTAAPELFPSTLNCTLVVLEETLVKTAMVPDTVAPESGELIEIVGSVVLLTVTATAALIVDCPAELLATAERE